MNDMDWMDYCIHVQYGLYIGYMRKILEYAITIAATGDGRLSLLGPRIACLG
jgi:hypothetical protein